MLGWTAWAACYSSKRKIDRSGIESSSSARSRTSGAPLAVRHCRAITQKPASTTDAAQAWAKAYVAYAASALSAQSGLPVTALAMQSIVVAAFTAAFNVRTAQGAAAAIAQGVTSFWSAMVWVGPLASGTTVFPGNAALSTGLAAVFGSTAERSRSAKS